MYSYDVGYKSNIDKEELVEILNQATELFTIAEDDFQHIKDKKWYKRLWEVVTFSNETEKCLAKNITNLSKVQDIVIKLIVKVAQENNDLSKILEGLIEKVDGLSDKVNKLVLKLRETVELVNFGKKPIGANDFTDTEKKLFIASVNSIAKEVSDTPLITEFCKMILHLFSYQCFSKDYEIDQLENISGEKAAFLYQYYLIMNYICTGSFEELHYEIESIVDCLCISPKKKSTIEENVVDMVNLVGLEGIIKYYNDSNIELSITDDGIEFETIIENDDVGIDFETTAADEEAEESNEEVDLSDDTRSQYFDLQELLINRFPSNCVVCVDEEGNYKLDESIIKKVKNFISKNNLIVHIDSAVSMFDTTIFGGAKEGILLTTWGIYHKNSSSPEVKYISYKEIERINYVLCEGNSRAIDVGNGIIFSEAWVPNNFVDVLKYIVDQARENENFVSSNDVIVELNEMCEGYKSLYIHTLSKLVSDCNLPLRDDNILLYLKNKAYELGISLSKLSDIWEGSIDGLDLYEGLKELKRDCPYPMYSMVQKLLLCDLYRINYIFSKNTVHQDVQETIDALLYLYEIDDKQIDRDFVLLNLRIEDDSITNQQLKDIVNSTADAIIGLGLSFFAGILSVSHPILSVCSFLGGNFGSKKISSTFFSDGKRNQFRVEVLSGMKEQYESLKDIIDDVEEKSILAKKIQNINKLIDKYSEPNVR